MIAQLLDGRVVPPCVICRRTRDLYSVVLDGWVVSMCDECISRGDEVRMPLDMTEGDDDG